MHKNYEGILSDVYQRAEGWESNRKGLTENGKKYIREEIAIDAMKAVDQYPIPMRLPCPKCGEIHVDEGEFATKPHHTHACQFCGMVWRPALAPTVGVKFLPGFKNP